MNSCLYQGVLRHRRLQPKAHHFVYRLFMAWLDLDELDRLPEAGIRRNRLAAAAWYDADYPLGAPLKAQALNRLPDDVTAVVSLCQVGREQVPPGIEHVPFRLIDRPEPDANPNLDFVLTDAAATIAALRDEGHVVLVHCVAAQSRTPTVGIAYSLLRGIAHERYTYVTREKDRNDLYRHVDGRAYRCPGFTSIT